MWDERDEATNRWIDLRGWVSRSYDAVVADLKVVDCGSLDVLLYCTDDVAASAPGEATLLAPADLA